MLSLVLLFLLLVRWGREAVAPLVSVSDKFGSSRNDVAE